MMPMDRSPNLQQNIPQKRQLVTEDNFQRTQILILVHKPQKSTLYLNVVLDTFSDTWPCDSRDWPHVHWTFPLFTPEVKLSPTRKSSSFVYERLKADRTNQIQDTDLVVNTDSEMTDKPGSSYNTRSLHNTHADRQIVEQNECRDRQIALLLVLLCE